MHPCPLGYATVNSRPSRLSLAIPVGRHNEYVLTKDKATVREETTSSV